MPFVTASLQPHPTRSWAVRSDKTRSSHQQFKHPRKPGLVTIAGSGDDDLAPGTLNSILEQAGLKNRGQEWVHALLPHRHRTDHIRVLRTPQTFPAASQPAPPKPRSSAARATPSSSISTASGPDSPSHRRTPLPRWLKSLPKKSLRV